jgi:hypothetical protein
LSIFSTFVTIAVTTTTTPTTTIIINIIYKLKNRVVWDVTPCGFYKSHTA